MKSSFHLHELAIFRIFNAAPNIFGNIRVFQPAQKSLKNLSSFGIQAGERLLEHFRALFRRQSPDFFDYLLGAHTSNIAGRMLLSKRSQICSPGLNAAFRVCQG